MSLAAVTASLFVLSGSAQAQYLFSESLVGPSNVGYYTYWNGSGAYGNSPVTANYSHSYTGMDGAGNTETMFFSGETISQSNYGDLHVYTTGTLDNSYYNSSNPIYYDNQTVNPEGSPNSLSSLGFAIFNDTLQFGGALVEGYQAIYVFHVDGTNSGVGALADLAVNVQGDPSQGFFAFEDGYTSTDWVTTPFQVNGQNQQNIDIQFSDQVVFNTFQLADGGNYSGTSDFSETLILAGIELVGPNGNLLSGWTVTSASGTAYHQIEGTSTPALPAAVAFASALPALIRRRRKRYAPGEDRNMKSLATA